MSYQLRFSDKAREELKQWAKFGTEKEKTKISSLLSEIKEHPRSGTGKVEPLKGNRAGQWSRRINSKDRIIYFIYDDIVEVSVISMKGHYGDK
ncbi:MAG: Txe/YoeB family addiction module toxin [Bacteroidales bacterium]|nr:Txe/YoeB family addiction module toxin [Bacteroidales bacterium]